MKRALLLISTLLIASAVLGREPIPVYGPARVAMDDDDLLTETILEPGVLAVSPSRIHKVYIGDGLTPGGVPIHPDGCITNFNGISVATTNLDMKSWSIKWGPWSAHGDANEWDLGYGPSEVWLSLVRDTGLAYLAYDFTIVDDETWRFEIAWSDDATMPVLEVSTNLLEGYAPADESQVSYTRVDVSHVVAEFTPADGADFYAFRLFAAERMSTGIYAREPLVAEKGISVGGVACTNWNDLPFIPRWPFWYKIGRFGLLDTNETPHIVESSGLFSAANRDMYLQIGSDGVDDSPVLNVGTKRAANIFTHTEPALNLYATQGHVNISAGRDINLTTTETTITSTNATSGLTLTNSAAGDFTVTWNGLTLTNWTDLAQWFTPKRPYWYQFGEEGDPPPVGAVGLFRDIWKITLRNTNDVDIVADGTNPMAIVPGAGVNISAPQGAVRIGAGMSASQMPILNKGLILGSTNGVIIDAPSVEASGGVKAASFTVGTNNIGEAVASVERRTEALEERAEEYWCKWTSATLSSNTTYKIPTNWPARTVFCHVYCERQGVVLVFPDWTPTEPYILHLIINKASGGGLALQAANGGALQTLTSSTAFLREVVFQFVPSVGWVTTYYTLGTNSHVINGDNRSSIQASPLPESGEFAPVIEPTTP